MSLPTTTASTTPPLLEVDELIKVYTVRRGLMRREPMTAVAGISFQVQPGETLALVGESGCGKSTTGKCILRLIDPDGGSIRFRGEPTHALPPAEFRRYRKHIQMVFQNPLTSFNPTMSIERALMEPLALREDLSEARRREEVYHLLEMVKLDKDFVTRYPRQMSGGQLQRVGIARALASQPQLVFLDEPTSALDMSVRGQVVNLLLDLQAEQHLSYVLVTHDLRLVQTMANRVLVMYLGEVVEEGKTEDIFAKPLHPYTQGLLAATLIGQKKRAKNSRTVRLRGEVPSVLPGFVGCKLYNRCPFAQERCLEPQELREILPGRRVRCWQALNLPTVSEGGETNG